MRVPIEIVNERRERLAQLLQQNRYLSVGELCERLDISEATARRDLAALEQAKRITRTHGGALVDFNLRFPSFQQRQHQGVDAKRQIASQVIAHVHPGMTLYLDAGTTVFAFARLLLERKIQPLTVITASLPVADLLADAEGMRVVLAGGEYLRRQSVLSGKTTQKILGEFSYDLAVIGAESANGEGVWNSQADVVKAQQTVLRHAKRAVLCMDSSKFNKLAPVFLCKWSGKLELVSELAPDEARVLLERRSTRKA